jgi:uncharacterized membrane protein
MPEGRARTRDSDLTAFHSARQLCQEIVDRQRLDAIDSLTALTAWSLETPCVEARLQLARDTADVDVSSSRAPYAFVTATLPAMCRVWPHSNPTDGPPEDGHDVHVTESRI